MRFVVEFDPRIQQTNFETTLGLEQTVEDLQLAISLNYNNIDGVYLEYNGVPLTNQKRVLADVVNKDLDPATIRVCPKDHIQLANDKFQGLKQNIATNLSPQDAKKYGAVLAAVVVFFLIYLMS